MKAIDGLVSWVRSIELGVWSFYLLFVVSFFCEVAFVKGAERLGGMPLSIAGLTAIGAIWGLLNLRFIDPTRSLNDPITRAALYLTRRWPLVGYLINALIIGGAPGVAIVAVKLNQPRRVALVSATAIAFAVVWTFIWK